MPITAQELAAELSQRIGPYSLLVNLSSVGAWAMREMGYSTLNPLTVTDLDLAKVHDDEINELLDFGQYGGSERVFDNLEETQMRQASITEDVEKARRTWRERCNHLLSKLQKQYGYGLPTLSEGEISFNFQARPGFRSRALGLESTCFPDDL